MAHRIEIGLKATVVDAHGNKIKGQIAQNLGLPVEVVRTIDVYTIDGRLLPEELAAIAQGPLSDPIINIFGIDTPLGKDFDWLIEVGFLPGVTDNVGKTTREALSLILDRPLEDTPPVYTSRQYLLKGSIDRVGATKIARELLANELIQRVAVLSAPEWEESKGQTLPLPRVLLREKAQIRRIDLAVLSDGDLIRLSQEGILALSLGEMKAIRDYFLRNDIRAAREAVGLDSRATDVELEALAQTWSEHCKHKIFNALIDYEDENGQVQVIESLFASCIKKATAEIRRDKGQRDWCLSVFSDNAGIIKFNDDYNVVFKVETHNSPSALDPYGGALTGIVGVNRDPFGSGIGAKLIFNTNVFCFASPDYDRPLPPRILHPRRIYEGVREGVEHGGNKSGIPTVNGCLVFDDRYLGKPLVYCGTGGIMPARIGGEETHLKTICPGDLLVMTGGRIGKDGIHGATFSSEELHEGSPVTAVQIGDPITQKKMTDFLLVARDRGLYRAITDNGAGGLSSSVGETARLAGGVIIDLEKAPLKYPGLEPWEILISESQERMTLAVPPEKIAAFLSLAQRMDTEATVIGEYTDSGWFHVRYEGRSVALIGLDFLHDGLPRLRLAARWKKPEWEEPSFPEPADLGKSLKEMLSRLNICSKESVVRQYDHEVQGGSVVKPLTGAFNDGPSDAAVIRPLLDSFEGLVVANGICPRFGDIDAYHMAACALDEAIRNAVAVGADLDHMACLDNFCWCDPVESEKNPDGAFKLAQLVRANLALYDYAKAFAVPIISGKDSMKNDYQIGDIKISIPPTLLFSVLAKMPDVRRAVTMDAKRPGDLVYVLGITKEELGGSEWYARWGYVGNRIPKVDAAKARSLYRSLSQAMAAGLVASCHDCSDGGLAVALAETAFAGDWGLAVDLDRVPCKGVSRNDSLLFSETPSRFVVTVPPSRQEAFEKLFERLPLGLVGRVVRSKILTITGKNGKIVCRETLKDLRAAWQKTLAAVAPG